MATDCGASVDWRVGVTGLAGIEIGVGAAAAEGILGINMAGPFSAPAVDGISAGAGAGATVGGGGATASAGGGAIPGTRTEPMGAKVGIAGVGAGATGAAVAGGEAIAVAGAGGRTYPGGGGAIAEAGRAPSSCRTRLVTNSE